MSDPYAPLGKITPESAQTHANQHASQHASPHTGRPAERRKHRRHELLGPQPLVERWSEQEGAGRPIGEIVDLSAGGVRVRTGDPTVRPGQTLQIRLSLPSHAGITPFIAPASARRDLGHDLEPACEWIGSFAVLRRVEREDGAIELGGRLVGMDDITRGMLGLYLSIQPLAA